MRDHDLGLHPSEQAPLGVRVRRVGDRYYPMRRCADGVYRGWNRRNGRGVPSGARTFATAGEAANSCRRLDRGQP